MPAIAHKTARLAVLAALAVPLVGDTHQQVIDLFTAMASALSEGNGLAFVQHVDHSMSGYQKLEADILALAAQSEVLSSIEVLRDDGDDRTRTVLLDWFLQIRSREPTGPLTRRREVVKCRLERVKKKWKVVAIEPLSFFSP